MKFFKKWLEKNRNKSEMEQKNVALFYASIITVVIFAFWIITLTHTGFSSQIDQISNSKSQVASPIESMFSGVKNIFSGKRTYVID